MDLGSRVPPEVRAGLERRKKHQEARGQDFRIRQPRQAEPRGVENRLKREMRKRISAGFELVEARLLTRLPSLLEDFHSELPFTQKSDGFGNDLFVIINGIKVQFAENLTTAQLIQQLKRSGIEVNAHNVRQFRRVFKQGVGVDPFRQEPWTDLAIDNYVEQNVSLIKSVEDRYFSEVEEIVHRGARNGLQTQEISRMIRERTKVAKSRADLIARDQVNKFNGQLNMIRQRDTGVTRYRWRTAQDERVRPQHAAREGRVYEWDDPPSDGHPGEPINCRCYAEPILEDLI